MPDAVAEKFDSVPKHSIDALPLVVSVVAANCWISELKALLFELCPQVVDEPAPIAPELPDFLEYRPRPP